MVSLAAVYESQSCITSIRNGIERILPNPFGGTKRSHDVLQSRSTVTRINSPGQRFTATHGINANVSKIRKLKNILSPVLYKI